MGRESSKLSRGRPEPCTAAAAADAMEEGSKSSSSSSSLSGQKWGCSSFSSSLYEKRLQGSGDWDQKNIESLVCTRTLQRSAARRAAVATNPRGKIVFPHIMTRGSVVGNKVFCKTSINNCFTWRQRSSMLFVNFYHERSSDIQSGIAQIASDDDNNDDDESHPPSPSPSPDHHRPLLNTQCRTLLLSVAGAAGMQLLCPALRLPLLQVLLFSHQQWPSDTSSRAALVDRARGRGRGFRGGREGGGGAWWRLPLNLALAASRPFYGSLLRRSLTAVLLVLRLRLTNKNERKAMRHMPNLYSTLLPTKSISEGEEFLDQAGESTDADIEVESASWESCSEPGDGAAVHAEELMEPDRRKGPAAREQDVISDDGLSSASAGSFEQDVISDDGLSSNGDSSDQDELELELSSIRSSLSSVDWGDRELDGIDLGRLSDESSESSSELSSVIPNICDSASAQPLRDSPESCSARISLESCSFDTLPASEEADEAQLNSTSDLSASSVEDDSSSSISSNCSRSSSSSDSSYGKSSSVVSTDDTEQIDRKLRLHIEHDEEKEEVEEVGAGDIEDALSWPRESSSISSSESSFGPRTEGSAEREETFGFSGEFHRLEDESPSLSPACSSEPPMGRENFRLFVRASSSGGLSEVEVPDDAEECEPDEPPAHSLELSPRADLTALTSEDYDSGSADGTWEIEVDGLAEDDPIYSVVWTPFADKRRRATPSQSDESEFSADDTDAGSQLGRDDDCDEHEHEHEGIHVPNADCRPSVSVQDWQKLDDCVQIESYNNFLGLDFNSVARCLDADLKSVTDDDQQENARVAPLWVPMTTSIRENDCELVSVDDRLRENEIETETEAEAGAEAQTAGMCSGCEREGTNPMGAAMPRIKLTEFLDGEHMSGLRESSDASTENSSTSRQHVLPGYRESPASEDDCNVDDVAARAASTAAAAAAAVVVVNSDSESEKFEHVDGARAQAPQLQEDDSASASASSSSSSSSSLEVIDEVDTSADTRSEGNSVSTESTSSSSSCAASLFADHPTCLNLRKLRHSHGDQSYLELPELLSRPWSGLVYWHGRCQEGRPTLVVLLGKAVRQLSSSELKHFITVTISHAEYAELNYFGGAVKQMNILMDLDGLGFMRLPPMHVMQSIGTILNRDYAGRGGWIFLINAPMMLGLVMSAIQRVILRPSYTKGAVIDKGFLEGKERIVTLGGRYMSTLLKHFDEEMLPSTLGGACPCGSNEARQCSVGVDFLSHQAWLPVPYTHNDVTSQ
ncbi:hypothetical protein MPTK1_6g20810 [Marchantia polymorpha subsp. ruderalis]|uniref:CRAL-TRIO domain-containing protein n=2 Tax=Marchantia polymorpha TaxID=3197 RepID=A0AAF6BUA4_MARPO|nr:hypothetical protein MARPO_0091s0075 [Marchantia polymorpha]BBN15588.1 hypothetical protein Mp_6g20810 [Marchantia polymorpha subsp. ruderalis]|eukprot:PTQ33231.1 hypothetical protein MARPO_0091s0075 [Marchantia polymorpha]